MLTKKFLVTAVSFSVLTFSILSNAETYRLTHNTSNATTYHQGAERFSELVSTMTDGEIDVRIFPNAVLTGGDQMRQAEMVGSGSIDFMVNSPLNVSTLIPEMAAFSLPYLFSNYEEVDAALQSEGARRIEEIAEERGFKILAWGENGFRELTNSVKPIESPEDLIGMKMRVAVPLHVDVFNTLGANPMQLQWSETFSALQQGVVDGQENPIGAVIVPQRLYEVQDYLTLWHYSYDPLFLAVSDELWESWGDETRASIQEAANQAMQYQVQISRDNTASGIELLEAQGMEVNRLSDDQLQAFREATRPAYDRWAVTVGEDIIGAFESAVENVQ